MSEPHVRITGKDGADVARIWIADDLNMQIEVDGRRNVAEVADILGVATSLKDALQAVNEDKRIKQLRKWAETAVAHE